MIIFIAALLTFFSHLVCLPFVLGTGQKYLPRRGLGQAENQWSILHSALGRSRQRFSAELS